MESAIRDTHPSNRRHGIHKFVPRNHKEDIVMRKLIDHLFFEDAGSFLHPKESKYTATEIVADVLATPFHLLGALTKRSAPHEHVSPPSDPQPPRVVYVERPAPAPAPQQSPADMIRQATADRDARIAACRSIADPVMRTRAEAMIEIAYRKHIAHLSGDLPPDGTSTPLDQHGLSAGRSAP